MARDAAGIFYGWRIVAACLLATLVGNALGLFGAGVYLHAIVAAHGWPTGLLSGAVTLFHVVSALLLLPVGGYISRRGPRLVVALGAVALASGVAGIGQVSAPWHAYMAFVVMGFGWASLSTTAIASTLAPWFDRYQGRAMSIASLGASAGGMMGAPILLYGIGRLGLANATALAGALAVLTILPLAAFVLRHRPQDMGLLPDGQHTAASVATEVAPQWNRRTALSTSQLRSVIAAFGIGMMVQIGFLTHQVSLLAETLSGPAIGATVSATAVTALLGRLILVRFADQLDARITAAAVLLTATGALLVVALSATWIGLIAGNIVFGIAVGNVTTLAPIIVRREFGAPSFGAIFGAAACCIQLAAALGPGLYGGLHDVFGDYRTALLLAGAMDAAAAIIILYGRMPPHLTNRPP